MMNKIKSESSLSFLEATSIIVGHGVGAGILSVPYLAAHNSLREILLIIAFCYLFNILLHLLIAELSLNNGGAQFVSCFESELFAGKLKTVLTWTAFALLGVSVIVNVSAFLTGAAAVFRSWFGLPDWAGILIFYVLGAGVVFVGMKLVGICEKFSVGAMVAVVGVLFIATIMRDTCPLPSGWRGSNNALAMFGMVSFSLSAVMSTPQVVKGLNGDAKRIRAGTNISEDGALVDLAASLGGWVSVVGYVFTLLALATSFWANTLNLRDIVSEQTGWSTRLSWLAASAPCLILAFMGLSSFVGFTRFASIIQVVTGLGIILAYNLSRKRTGSSALLGRFGALPFQILIACCSLLATVGAVLPVT